MKVPKSNASTASHLFAGQACLMVISGRLKGVGSARRSLKYSTRKARRPLRQKQKTKDLEEL